MTGETHNPQPGGRAPAPGPLALVQAFLNTHYDLGSDHGAEVWRNPEAYAAWLRARRLLADGATVGPDELTRALRVRDALRELARGDGGAAAALTAADEGVPVEVRFTAGGPGVRRRWQRRLGARARARPRRPSDDRRQLGPAEDLPGARLRLGVLRPFAQRQQPLVLDVDLRRPREGPGALPPHPRRRLTVAGVGALARLALARARRRPGRMAAERHRDRRDPRLRRRRRHGLDDRRGPERASGPASRPGHRPRRTAHLAGGRDPAGADRGARAVSQLELPPPAEVVLMNPVRLSGTVVRPVGITPRSEAVGRSRRSAPTAAACAPGACPVLVRAAAPGSLASRRRSASGPRSTAPSVRLIVTGTRACARRCHWGSCPGPGHRRRCC